MQSSGSKTGLRALVVGAIGVVFGDIGTSRRWKESRSRRLRCIDSSCRSR